MPSSANRNREPLLRPRTILIGILLILVLILLVQNSFILPFRFLFWKIPASLHIVLPGVFLVGFIVGYLVRAMSTRSRQSGK